MRAKPPREFLNVDLEIVSRSKLNSVETALGDTAHALYSGPIRRGIFLLSLECNRYPKDPDAAIVTLCDALERLGKAERRMWERALTRTFDVGYGLSRGDAAVHVALQPATLGRVVALGATVAFTCYRDDGESDCLGAESNARRRTGKTKRS